MTVRTFLCIFAAVLACAAPVGAQGAVVFVRPGVAYSPRLQDAGLGLTAGALVIRTRTVSVGGEVGHYSLGSRVSSFAYMDPVYGAVSHTETHGHDFWVGAAIARYAIEQGGSTHLHAILGTGIYNFRSVDSYEENSLSGGPARIRLDDYESAGLVPGVGAGIGVTVPLAGNRWGADIELRIHTLIGADAAIYPVVTLTAGLGTLLGVGR